MKSNIRKNEQDIKALENNKTDYSKTNATLLIKIEELKKEIKDKNNEQELLNVEIKNKNDDIEKLNEELKDKNDNIEQLNIELETTKNNIQKLN